MNKSETMTAGPEDSLEDVVDRASRGDLRALERIFEMYYDGVYRYALLRIGNQADAEESASEVFLQVVRSIRKYKDRGKGFGAWVYGIARNIVAEHHRRGARRPETPSDQLPESPSAALEETVVERENARSLMRALKTLPDEQAQLLALRFAGGLSAEEIGAVLGKSPGAVRIQQMRALSALRDRIEVAL